MLQDLEAREDDNQAINADYQPPTKRHSKRLIFILIAVGTLAILYGLFMPLHNTQEPNQTSAKMSDEGTASQVKPKPMLQQSSSPASITQEQKLSIENSNKVLVEVPHSDILNNESPNQIATINDRSTTVQLHSEAPKIQSIKPSVSEAQNQDTQLPQVKTNTETTTNFTMVSSQNEAQSVDLKQQISEHLAAGNNTKAASLLKELTLQQPKNILARKKLASIQFALGNHKQAKLLLAKSIEEFPTRSDLRLMLARVFVSQSNNIQALEVLVDAQAESGNQEFLAYRASLAKELKQMDIARSDYSALTQLNPTNSKWWLGLAVIEDQTGNVNNALVAYKKSMQGNQLETAVSEFVQQRILILAESK